MKWQYLFAVALLAQPAVSHAQQAAQQGQAAAAQGQAAAAAALQGGRGGRGGPVAVGDPYAMPEGITTAKSKLGPVHADSKGMTMYLLNARFAAFARQGGDPNKFCAEECQKTWKVVAAPADAKPIGFWKVVEGAQGPQWSYKDSLVFTHVNDKTPADLAGHNLDDMWTASLYVPPVPKITAPGHVAPIFREGEYVLMDKQGHALYAATKNGDCGKTCVSWVPFGAGMASQGVGEWTVVRDSDRPQWAYKGKPVFVTENTSPQTIKVPEEATILKP